MPNTIIFGFSVAAGLLAWATIFKTFVWPRLGTLPMQRRYERLLSIHFFRYLGSVFLITGVTAHELPSGFAVPAVAGDLIAFALALLAFAALRRSGGKQLQNSLIWLFSVAGTLDLLAALTAGYLLIPDPGDFGAAYFIPTFYVPLLLVSHFYILRISLRPMRG
ncbi:hypothetical protein AB0J86_36800 [Micromonospora sp. NPDC049559]|uniref:hypothetical protein n=1 Tax=Micromonospora sp. NPDC049559 TaxID=3155923 RepID=UPI003417C2ED